MRPFWIRYNGLIFVAMNLTAASAAWLSHQMSVSYISRRFKYVNSLQCSTVSCGFQTEGVNKMRKIKCGMKDAE